MSNLQDCKEMKARTWQRAEAAMLEIIGKIQQSITSEEERKSVIDYVQRLLEGYFACKVFVFGSVPLKTYLPDGDIDLTVFGGTISQEEHFADNVVRILKSQHRDEGSTPEFPVEDVQYIDAEVKLVKCLVNKVVVDISFNQVGGLSTVCFLEKVDRLIGRDNLFKKSIILVKAWCYYESRILGSHYGLLSTYALETMVLQKFLDYYSKFNWEKYGVSLFGPVCVSSLPELVDDSAEEPLLSQQFLHECVEALSVPSTALSATPLAFTPKHLNIVDPLKESNNLGRSISKGNSVRIRSAFSLGALKLEKVLSQPTESIFHELGAFFGRTLDRLGEMEENSKPGNQSPHSHNEAKNFSIGTTDLRGDYESLLNNLQFGQCCYRYVIAPPVSAQSQIRSANVLVPGDAFCLIGSLITSKPRGTGAFIPSNDHSQAWEARIRQNEEKEKGSETSQGNYIGRGPESCSKHHRSTCPAPRMRDKWVPAKTYNLEDEDEFPSLSTLK
ncbi:poly(A) RNA polymerase cid14-like isoform X2 [Punica granatum]|uniref:Poly(A) RNA polymerase cid14-like isoform X2 n=2 Tax=Punica granatum TaxID=22663 RepID=A0A6P8DSD1_PUNGR|nr:poly(A) RNA polymerase cid14-like isoform X2 [Punica granatum]PKI38008.1 hypothetical protein CRG98_041604 [Punica granatum]